MGPLNVYFTSRLRLRTKRGNGCVLLHASLEGIRHKEGLRTSVESPAFTTLEVKHYSTRCTAGTLGTEALMASGKNW